MNREYHYWDSPSLGRRMELLVFGHGGARVLVFPTSQGRFYQYEDFSMVATLSHHIENGWIQLFCVDSVDSESWYNKSVHPSRRALRHVQYDQYIVSEVLPFIYQKNPTSYLIATGCSFGAYHSMNFSLRHPELVNRCIAISGEYDMHPFLDGYYDDNAYFNSPVDYMQNMSDERYLAPLRSTCRLIMTAGDNDICLGGTLRLGNILKSRGVPVEVDIWGNGTVHDWPPWKQMILKYI